jgi:hypothetical protein
MMFDGRVPFCVRPVPLRQLHRVVGRKPLHVNVSLTMSRATSRLTFLKFVSDSRTVGFIHVGSKRHVG